MGFYTKSNYLYLPNKRIVDDLIEREGSTTKESFTPFNGMNHLISEQMVGSRYSVLGIDIIKANIKELHVTRLNNNNVESTSDYGVAAAYSLDELDENVVLNYLRNQLIGLKINKTGARDIIIENEKIQHQMYDSETGESFNMSDVYSSDEYEESNSILLDIKLKIPHLLKKLQDGSIQYGVSLLSLFIARDGVIQQRGKVNGVITPRELLAYPIYRVTSTGDLIDTFDPATANNIAKFREPKDLVLGVYPDDPYYKAGIELTIKAKQLNYNLYEEDIRDYNPSYINRLMCSYIASNQEVLSDLAVYDPSIMALFKNGSIFKTSTINDQEVVPVNKILNLRNMARQKLSLVPSLYNIIDANKVFDEIASPVKLINQFFKVYKEVNLKSKMEEETTYDCSIDSETLCTVTGEPLMFKGDAFVIGFGDTPMFNSVYFIITTRGYVIKIDDDFGKVIMTDIVSILTYFETKNDNLFNKKEIQI